MKSSKLPRIVVAAVTAWALVLADTPAGATTATTTTTTPAPARPSETPQPAPEPTPDPPESSAPSTENPASPSAEQADDGSDHYAGSQIARHEGRQGEPYAGKGRRRILGNDVSRWQGEVNWWKVKRKGAKFSYIKATEGTGYQNPHYAQQYNGAHAAGLIRGAYHFARPDVSSGPRQANYFVRHGGRWTPDGKTLPGMVDLEYNPYGETCYGRGKTGMLRWIKGFSLTYKRLTGRRPVIYTSTSWWKKCTGNSPRFASSHHLWIARYNSHIGELPAGWNEHLIWQFSDRGKLPGDQNYFNGSMRRLKKFARG